MTKKRDNSDLVALRLPLEIQNQIKTDNISSFIKEAIQDKLDKDAKLKTCPTCKGKGKVRG